MQMLSKAINPTADAGRKAAFSALLYMLFCGGYIWWSSHFAAQSAGGDVARLKQIETTKGFLFILVTGLLFYLISLMRWRQILKDQTTISLQENALIDMEKREVVHQFAASVGHDLNNVLIILEGLLQEIRNNPNQVKDVAPITEKVNLAVSKLHHFSSRITDVVKRREGEQHETFPLFEAVKDVLMLV